MVKFPPTTACKTIVSELMHMRCADSRALLQRLGMILLACSRFICPATSASRPACAAGTVSVPPLSVASPTPCTAPPPSQAPPCTCCCCRLLTGPPRHIPCMPVIILRRQRRLLQGNAARGNAITQHAEVSVADLLMSCRSLLDAATPVCCTLPFPPGASPISCP